MPIVKLTLTADEMALLKRWANGSAVATIAKHAVLLKATNDLGTHQVPTEGTTGTLPVPSTHAVPTKYPSGTQSELGIERALQSPKKEEVVYTEETVQACQRIIGHFNQTCGGLVATMDKSAIAIIAPRLEIYTEADAKAVVDWAQVRWPPGSKYRYCVKISYLFGSKFGEHLTASKQEAEKTKVFHPGPEFMIDYEEPDTND